MSSVKDKKERIIRLIDKSNKQGPKIAFYSDQQVSVLIDELYKRWENSGRVGIPLDYATDEEIDLLYCMAVKYSSTSDEEAWFSYLSKENGRSNEVDKSTKKKSLWRKIFWFILPS